METQERPGRVTKCVYLSDGHDAVYVSHRLEGYHGATTLGHHATLRCTAAENGILIDTSAVRLGMTAPRPAAAAYTSGGEYYALAPLEPFEALSAVPTVWRDAAAEDLSRFPRRRGFVDIAAVSQEPSDRPVWTTAHFVHERFLWYSLKKTDQLPLTVVWTENHGRHQSPWSGRNCCIGLEDVCGYFAEGLSESAQANELNARGIPTVVQLHPARPTTISYIQGAIPVPENFDRVVDVRFSAGSARFVSNSGATAEARVDTGFLESGTLTIS
jgi:hypothetical protein